MKRQLIKTIILAGNRDFGRCPIASQLPTALWPVAGTPVVERLICSLAKQGIKQVTICCNGDSKLLTEKIKLDKRLEANFIDVKLPIGTAGCIRKAASNIENALLLIMPASVINLPNIDKLIMAHHNGKSEMTVFLNPSQENGIAGQASGIYICSQAILKHIPKDGYFDIKEGLIPGMLRAGKTVHAATLPHHVGNFRDRTEYLYAIDNYLGNNPKLNALLKLYKQNNSKTLWIADSAKVNPGARIYGPVAIMNGASVSKGAVIFGPTIIGKNVRIGNDSVIINTVIWDDAQIGQNCELRHCLVDYQAIVPANTNVLGKSIPFKQPRLLTILTTVACEVAKNSTTKLQMALKPRLSTISKKLPSPLRSKYILTYLMLALVLIAFLWSYWPNLTDLWHIWQRSDEYGCGLLVPFLAIYILWSRRHEIIKCPIKPSFWGLLVFLAAQTIRLIGLFFMYGSAERLSIALSIAGLVLLLFGWQLFRKVSTVLLFLFLMLPWPNRVQAAVALPLQRWATSSAVFCLETMGYEVIQEGNIIHIGQASVAVAEACNGLRMITAFFVISGLVVLLVKRPLWQKLVVLTSSLPIALLCNTVRLTVTAIAFTVVSGDYWENIFHDFGGYAMMPLALATVVAELWLLPKLTSPPTKYQAIIITRQNA